MGIKNFIHKVKIFIWYLATEPVRQIKQFLVAIRRFFDALNKTITWGYLAIIFMGVSMLINNRYYFSLFFFFLLFVILLWEWERGFFMKRYREKVKKDIYKKINEEDMKNG